MQLMHLKTRDPKPTTKGKGDLHSQPGLMFDARVSVMDLIADGWTLLGPPVIYSLEFHWYMTKEK